MAEPEDEAPSVLLPCSICSRTFKPESLQKHVKVCEKQLTKKRKVFDSSKQRIQGTELAEFLPTILREKKSEKVTVKKQESKWKEKHLEFVRAIRAARGVEVESSKNVPAPRSSNEKCPHCDRNFGPKAFDRHVEWCKEQKARIPKSPGSLQAKERLEARTKYRAPPLAKSKRTLTREKYARVSQHSQELSPVGCKSTMSFSKVPQNYPQEPKAVDINTKNQGARNKPKVSASSPSCVFPSGNATLKRREPSPSPSKRPVRSKNTGKPTVIKQRHEDPSHRENTFTSSSGIMKSQTTNEKSVREGKSHPVEKRIPVPKATLNLQKTQERKAAQSKISPYVFKSNDGGSCKSHGTVDLHSSGKQVLQLKPSVSYKNNTSNNTCEMSHEASLGVVPVSFHDSEGNTSCESLRRTESRAQTSMTRRQKPKLNDIDVNNENEGLIVSPCSILKAEDNFITWRDIAKNTETVFKRTNTDLESDDCNRTYTVVSSCTDDSQTNNDIENNVSVEEFNIEDYCLTEKYASKSESSDKEKDNWTSKLERSCTDLLIDRKSCLSRLLDQDQCNTMSNEISTLNSEDTFAGSKCNGDTMESLGITALSLKENAEEDKEKAIPLERLKMKLDVSNNLVVFEPTSSTFEDTFVCNDELNDMSDDDEQKHIKHYHALSSVPECYEGYVEMIQQSSDNKCISFGNKTNNIQASESGGDISICDGKDLFVGDIINSTKLDVDSEFESIVGSFKSLNEQKHFYSLNKPIEKVISSTNTLKHKIACDDKENLLETMESSLNSVCVKDRDEMIQNLHCDYFCTSTVFSETTNRRNISPHFIARRTEAVHDTKQEILNSNDNQLFAVRKPENTIDVENLSLSYSAETKQDNVMSSVKNSKEHLEEYKLINEKLISSESNMPDIVDSKRLLAHNKKENCFPFCRKSCFCCFEKSGQLTHDQALSIWQSCKKEALEFLGLSNSSNKDFYESSESNDDVIDSIWDLASQEFIRVMKDKSATFNSYNDSSDIITNVDGTELNEEEILLDDNTNLSINFEPCKTIVPIISKAKILFPHNSNPWRHKKCFSIFKIGKKYKKCFKLTRIIRRPIHFEESLVKMFSFYSLSSLTISLKMILRRFYFPKTVYVSSSTNNLFRESILKGTLPGISKHQQIKADINKLFVSSDSVFTDEELNDIQQTKCKSKLSENCGVNSLRKSDSDNLPLNNLMGTNTINTGEEIEEIVRVNSALENVTIRTFGIMDPCNMFNENYHKPPLHEMYHLENLLFEQECGFPKDVNFSTYYSPSYEEFQENASSEEAKFHSKIEKDEHDFSDMYYSDPFFQGSNAMYGSMPMYEVGDQYFLADNIYNQVEMCTPEMPYAVYVFPDVPREGCIITEYCEEDSIKDPAKHLDENNCEDSFLQTKKSGDSVASCHEVERSDDSLDVTSPENIFKESNSISNQDGRHRPCLKINIASECSSDESTTLKLASFKVHEKFTRVKSPNSDQSVHTCNKKNRNLFHEDHGRFENEILINEDLCSGKTQTCVQLHHDSEYSSTAEYADNDSNTPTSDGNMEPNSYVVSHLCVKNVETFKESTENKLSFELDSFRGDEESSDVVHKSLRSHKNTLLQRKVSKKLNENDFLKHAVSIAEESMKDSTQKMCDRRKSSLNTSQDSLETYDCCDNIKSYECITSSENEEINSSSNTIHSSMHIPFDSVHQNQEENEELQDISCLGVNFPSFLYDHIDYHNGNVKVWTNSIKQKKRDDFLSDDNSQRIQSARNISPENKETMNNSAFSENLKKHMFELQKSNDSMFENSDKKSVSKLLRRNHKEKILEPKSYGYSLYSANVQSCVDDSSPSCEKTTTLLTSATHTNSHGQRNSKLHRNKLTLPEIHNAQADPTPKLKSAKEHNASLSKLVEKWMIKQKNLKTSQSAQDVHKKKEPEQIQPKRQTRKIHRLPPLSALPKHHLKTRTKLPRVPGGRVLQRSPYLRLLFRKAVSSSEEVYDPYKSAERQMMELLSQGDYVQPSVQQNKNVLPLKAEPTPTFPSFESSHKSAFVRYSPPTLSHFPDDSLIPSSLIAEFEDLFIAESQKSSCNVDNSISISDENKNKSVSLASIGLNLSNNNTESAQTSRKPSKIRAKMESASLSLQRSVALMNYETDIKIETDANILIQTDEDSNPLPVPSEFSSFSFSSPEPVRSFPSSKSHYEKGDADKKLYEENYVYKLETTNNELNTQSKCHFTAGKFNADSAYGSLNRRSPGSQKPEKHDVDAAEGERMCMMSSSGSESSLPPLCSVQVVKSEASNPSSSPSPSLAVSTSPVTQSVPRMSKFCHECGFKYPVSLAKFCCECGVRRLAM